MSWRKDFSFAIAFSNTAVFPRMLLVSRVLGRKTLLQKSDSSSQRLQENLRACSSNQTRYSSILSDHRVLSKFLRVLEKFTQIRMTHFVARVKCHSKKLREHNATAASISSFVSREKCRFARRRPINRDFRLSWRIHC